MKKIMVERTKCPIDVIAELGKEAKEAWIFLSPDCVQNLTDTSDAQVYEGDFAGFKWDASEASVETTVYVEYFFGGWASVFSIQASDIVFTNRTTNTPTETYILEMQK